jgi:hypothetical protein
MAIESGEGRSLSAGKSARRLIQRKEIATSVTKGHADWSFGSWTS